MIYVIFVKFVVSYNKGGKMFDIREQYKKEWQEYAKSRTSQKSVSHTESTPKPKTYT